jgi:hypothetical protein
MLRSTPPLLMALQNLPALVERPRGPAGAAR